MKQYLEQRIKELNEKYERYLKQYQETTSDTTARNLYVRLEKLDTAITELEKVLAMVE
jgi:hypothetical protein